MLTIMISFSLFIFREEDSKIWDTKKELPILELFYFNMNNINTDQSIVNVSGEKLKRYNYFDELDNFNIVRVSEGIEQTISSKHATYDKGIYIFDDGINYQSKKMIFYSEKGIYNSNDNLFFGRGIFSLRDNDNSMYGIDIFYDKKKNIIEAKNIKGLISSR